MRFFPICFWGCIHYGIFSVPWLVQGNRTLLHVVSMMLYCLAYCVLILLSLVRIEVCGCIQMIKICACRTICGDELFIS